MWRQVPTRTTGQGSGTSAAAPAPCSRERGPRATVWVWKHQKDKGTQEGQALTALTLAGWQDLGKAQTGKTA